MIVMWRFTLICLLALLLAWQGDSWLSNRATRTRRTIFRALEDDEREERPRLEVVEENDGPRISIEEDSNSNDAKKRESAGKKKSFSYTSSVPSTGFNTDRLFADEEDKKKMEAGKKGSATFGGMSVDDLQSRMQESPYRAQSWDDLPDQKEDLNGINPVSTITFSVVPMAMCFALVQVTSWLSANFAIDQVDSDVYPIQRGAVVARNLVVGISSLATGFTGVIGLGLFAMGVAVAVGVAKGELDPSADNITGRVD